MISSDEHYLWEERFDSFRSYQNISALRLSENIADYFNGVVLQRLSGLANGNGHDGKMRFQVMQLTNDVTLHSIFIIDLSLYSFIAGFQCINCMDVGVYYSISRNQINGQNHDLFVSLLLSVSRGYLH